MSHSRGRAPLRAQRRSLWRFWQTPGGRDPRGPRAGQRPQPRSDALGASTLPPLPSLQYWTPRACTSRHRGRHGQTPRRANPAKWGAHRAPADASGPPLRRVAQLRGGGRGLRRESGVPCPACDLSQLGQRSVVSASGAAAAAPPAAGRVRARRPRGDGQPTPPARAPALRANARAGAHPPVAVPPRVLPTDEPGAPAGRLPRTAAACGPSPRVWCWGMGGSAEDTPYRQLPPSTKRRGCARRAQRCQPMSAVARPDRRVTTVVSGHEFKYVGSGSRVVPLASAGVASRAHRAGEHRRGTRGRPQLRGARSARSRPCLRRPCAGRARLAPRCRVDERYRIIKAIGSGAYGLVVCVRVPRARPRLRQFAVAALRCRGSTRAALCGARSAARHAPPQVHAACAPVPCAE